jgi:hypothetical protein
MDIFWTLNPKIMFIYQTEYLRKQTEENKHSDMLAYLNGTYMVHAVATCMPGSTHVFPTEPIAFFNTEKEEKVFSNEDARREANKLLQWGEQLRSSGLPETVI